MGRVIARRIALLPVLLVGISLLVFLLAHLIPGDPARLLAGGQQASEAQVAAVRTEYGLDDPLPIQYIAYVGRLARGDLGYSLSYKKSVASVLGDRAGATLELTVAALLLGVAGGVLLGIVAARRRNSWADHTITLFCLAGASLPLFWLGLMLVWLFSVKLGVLPLGGRLPAFTTLEPITGIDLIDAPLRGQWSTLWEALRHLVLPAVTLAIVPMAVISRVARASFVDVLAQDYIVTARAYGVSERRIVWQHAAKNALLPLVTLFGILVPALVAGAVLVEVVFSWPGVGTLLVDALLARDYAVVQSVTIVIAALVIVASLVVDLSYTFLDPRTRRAWV